MTKSRFKAGIDMRLPCVAALALALGLSGCGYGTTAEHFDFPQVQQAYIPLHSGVLTSRVGAAVVIAPGVAVTNAHNANLLDGSSVIGTSTGYDLLYFRTSQSAQLPTAAVFDGEEVLAYGQDTGGDLRVSRGTVHKLWPAAFGFVSDAGPGFSGGPVVDAKTGALVGITYGYQGDEDAKTRLMVAYNMAFVRSEYASVQSRPH